MSNLFSHRASWDMFLLLINRLIRNPQIVHQSQLNGHSTSKILGSLRVPIGNGVLLTWCMKGDLVLINGGSRTSTLYFLTFEDILDSYFGGGILWSCIYDLPRTHDQMRSLISRLQQLRGSSRIGFFVLSPRNGRVSNYLILLFIIDTLWYFSCRFALKSISLCHCARPLRIPKFV